MILPKKRIFIDPRTLFLKYLGNKVVTWMLDFDEKEYHRGIVIAGDTEFCKKVLESLELLKSNDEFRYKVVLRYIKVIYSNRKFLEGFTVSGLAVMCDDWVKFNKPIRIASYIVRLSVMSQLFERFHMYRITKKARHEKILAYKQELKTAENLGSTMSHIMHLEKFIKNHV